MKKGNWIAIDKRVVSLLPTNREYTVIEALISLSVDRDNKKEGSIRGYASLWGWSRCRVRRFVQELTQGLDHQTNHRKTGKRQSIRLIFPKLENERDNRVDHHIDHQQDPTKNLYPKSLILKKDNRVAEQVQPTLPLCFEDFVGKNQNSLNRDKVEAIQYFLTIYARTMGDQHPRLKPEQWERVIEKIFTVEDDDNVIDLNGCKDLINKYFSNTARYAKNCNYSLIHFNTFGVKKNLFYEELY